MADSLLTFYNHFSLQFLFITKFDDKILVAQLSVSFRSEMLYMRERNNVDETGHFRPPSELFARFINTNNIALWSLIITKEYCVCEITKVVKGVIFGHLKKKLFTFHISNNIAFW